MITAAIIAEYNPFHSGHQYHIEETRRMTGADYVVVVMSGDFVQRGEPAVADKYVRSRMALLGGADVVIELPVYYASASAEYFASAGVRLLTKLGCVNYLSFGSEWADISDYEVYTDVLIKEPELYKEVLGRELKAGKNFASARSAALFTCLKRADFGDTDPAVFLAQPNHILGLEYLKALRRMQSEIIPLTVKREGAGYHDHVFGKGHPSASAVRRKLREVDWKKEQEMLKRAMPAGAKPFLRRYRERDFVSWDDLMPLLDYYLLMNGEEKKNFFGVDKDLFMRIQKNYEPGMPFHEIIRRLHTKRLTDAALRRALLHILLQMEHYPFLNRASQVLVPYARVLGFTKKALPLLKKMREKASLDIMQRPVEGMRKYVPDSPEGLLYKADIKAAALYEQTAARKSGRSPQEELTRQQIIIE